MSFIFAAATVFCLAKAYMRDSFWWFIGCMASMMLFALSIV